MKIPFEAKFLILCLITGCWKGNGFTVNEKRNTLNMSSVSFYIQGDYGDAFYHLKEGSFSKDIKEIYLLKNNPDYTVDVSGNICCKLNDSTFVFKPKINQVYKITNCSNGDASSYTVKVLFDSSYNVHVVKDTFKYEPEKYIDTTKPAK